MRVVLYVMYNLLIFLNFLLGANGAELLSFLIG